MRANNALSLQNISFRYEPSAHCALDDASVEIPANSITALLGPNGSGKSTLLNIVLGLFAAEKGKVLLLERDSATYSRREKSRILSLVPQDEHVVFDLSVLEYILLGRAPYMGLLDQPGSEDRKLAREAMSIAGISSLEKRSVPSLSGGERQLVTVARALAQQTEILLLDEPTSHLDLANARRILSVMRSLKKAGKTIVFTTHDPNAAAAAADFVILLRGGKVISCGAAIDELNAANLSATYGVDVEVMTINGRPLVLTHKTE
jgi:iron complex transport system ATP-binding protein